MNAVKKITYKNYTIGIYPDDFECNPRDEFEHFGTMVFFHRRYSLGDKHNYSVDELQDELKTGQYLYLPVYAYEHGGITISTGRGYPFNDVWDSGQLGVIMVSKENVRKEYSCKRITKKVSEKVYNLLRAEVQEYDDYLTGNVYGYKVFAPAEDGEVLEDDEENLYGGYCSINDDLLELDSCWGFFGDIDKSGIIEEAKSVVDYYVANPVETYSI